jgi:sporulation protein YlmC with PRC-barrel domain
MSERQDETGQELENRLSGTIDGALHLLDRQLLDCNGEMLGKVDDVELLDTPNGLTITAVLTGPAALLDRLGGRLGRTLTDRWRRLRISEPHRDRPWRIDFADVERLDSALHLSVPREGVVRRDREEHRLARLTGMDAIGPDGNRVGRILDARFACDDAGRLVLHSLVVGHGRPGSLLGYDRDDTQGPWLVRVVVRRIHRHTVVADAADAHISWDQSRVRLDRLPTEPPSHAFN